MPEYAFMMDPNYGFVNPHDDKKVGPNDGSEVVLDET